MVQVREVGTDLHVEAQLLLKVMAKVYHLDETSGEVTSLSSVVIKTQGTSKQQQQQQQQHVNNVHKAWNTSL